MTSAPALLDRHTEITTAIEPDSFAEFLERLLRYRDDAVVTVRDILGGLESRAFGIPLAVLATFEIVPLPVPGLSLLISAPMAAIGAQMLVDGDRLWLPDSLLNRRLPAHIVKKVARAMLPAIRQIDRVSQPRLSLMSESAGSRLVGLAILWLATLIALPIPGTNAPLALTAFVLAVGLIRKDGLLIAAGLLLTIVVTALLGSAAMALMGFFFGA